MIFMPMEMADGLTFVTNGDNKWWEEKWRLCTSLEGAPDDGPYNNSPFDTIMREEYWSGPARECMSDHLLYHWWLPYVTIMVAVSATIVVAVSFYRLNTSESPNR